MADIDSLSIKIESESTQAAERVNALASALERLQGAVKGNGLAAAQKQIAGIGASAESATPNQKKQQILSAAKDQVGGSAPIPIDVDKTQVEDATKEIEILDKAKDQVGGKNTKLKIDSSDVDKAHKKVGILSNALRAIKRIAFYRAIRAGMKAISGAFSEGIQNLYQFSKMADGKFAASMDTLATSAQYLKNSLGAMASPLINAVAPVVDFLIDKFVALLNIINQVFAALSGSGTYTKATKQTKEFATATGGAGKALKQFMLGIDELNVIDTSGGGGGGGAAADFGTMFEEADVGNLAKDLGKGLGELPLIGDLKNLIKDLNDIASGDYDWGTIVSAIGNFAGTLAPTMLLFGKIKTAGALYVVEGLSKIVTSIKDMSENGINWDNVSKMLRGIGDLATGIGLITGNFKLAGAGLALDGLVGVIDQVKNIIEAGKTGDWSNVSWTALAIDAVKLIAGLAFSFGLFDKLKGLGGGKASEGVSAAAEAVSGVHGSIQNNLAPKLKNLATNLGWGILIIGEVAIAAGLFVGAIWGLGVLLEKVGEAWQPVIDNGETVAIAMGIGTGILLGIGVVTALLGSVGTPLIVNIALGTAILAELGIAAGLFIVEIWAIGKGLDEIGQAWQPVLDNSDTIITAIEVGTGLLVGIGIVTAALGVATVASAGLLPLAIGLGTAILVELAAAFILFTESLVAVANELSNNLAPALSDLNGILPGLNTDLNDFVDFISEMATEISDYTASMGSLTWSSIVGKFQKLFAGNPIDGFAGDVGKIKKDIETLSEKLGETNPELKTAVGLLKDYDSLMDELKVMTSKDRSMNISEKMFTNFKEAGKKLVVGFKTGISENSKLPPAEIENINSECLKKIQESAFKSKGVALVKQLAQAINDNASSVVSASENMFNSLLSKMELFTNRCRDAMNSLVGDFKRSMNGLSVSGSGVVSSISLDYVSIPHFKTGGFPETGQAFIARESGPELVGNIGRRTAVANNEQIVQGIASGVADANEEQNALLREQNELLRAILSKDNSVRIGDREIKRAYDTANRKSGAPIMAGGVFA